MNDIDIFMKNNSPQGKSKLDVYQDEILLLKKHGYSNKDVLRFLLEMKGLQVGSATLTRFISRAKGNIAAKPMAKSQELPKNEPVHTLSSQNNSSETAAGKKPFNWEAAKEEDWRDLI